MKLFLLSVVCLVGTTLAVPVTRPRRDILPGDPRYGTDYHHQHHHHHENEVEVTKSVGGYMYTLPASVGSNQLPHQTYGAPFQQASEPLKDYQPVVEDVKKTVEHIAPLQIQTVQKQADTNRAPVSTQHQATHTVQHVKQQTFSAPTTSYGTPVQHQQVYKAPQQKQTASNQYLTPAIQQSHSTETVHQVEQVQQVQQVQPVQHVEQVHHVQPVQHVQHVEQVRHVQPVQHVQHVEQVHQVQPVQHVQHVQKVQQPQAFSQYGPPPTPVANVQRVQESRHYLTPAQSTEVTSAPLIQDHVHFQRTQTYQAPQPAVQTFSTFSTAFPSSYQTSDLGSAAQFNLQDLSSAYGAPSAPLQVHQAEHHAPLQVHNVEHPAPLQVHHVEQQIQHQAPLQVHHVEHPAPLQVHQVEQQVQHQAPLQVHHVEQQVQHQAPLQVHHVQQHVQHQVPQVHHVQQQVQHVAPVQVRRFQQQPPLQVHQFEQQFQQQFPSFQEVKNFQATQNQYLTPQVQQVQSQYRAPQVHHTVKETVQFEAPVQSVEIPFSSFETQQSSFDSSSEAVNVESVGKISQSTVQVNSQSYADNGGYVY